MNLHPVSVRRLQFSLLLATAFCLAIFNPLSAQELHSRWDELTASDWPKALDRSGHTCILPIGILEKLTALTFPSDPI